MISYWVGHLFAALFYAAIAQFAAQLAVWLLPQVSRGLYQAVRLRRTPDDWMVSFVRFATLFLLATVAGGVLGLGGLTTWLVLAWLGYNVYRSVSGPEPAAQPGGGDQPLNFVLRTTSGPNVRLGNPFRGTFIAGGAGSGKSKSIIEPIIQQAGALGLTGVVYNFKFPTLAEEVAGSYQGSPVTPYFVNFTDLTRSHRVNPLAPALLATASFAREAAATIIPTSTRRPRSSAISGFSRARCCWPAASGTCAATTPSSAACPPPSA